jgi:hypothetical protein
MNGMKPRIIDISIKPNKTNVNMLTCNVKLGKLNGSIGSLIESNFGSNKGVKKSLPNFVIHVYHHLREDHASNGWKIGEVLCGHDRFQYTHGRVQHHVDNSPWKHNEIKCEHINKVYGVKAFQRCCGHFVVGWSFCTLKEPRWTNTHQHTMKDGW